MDTFCSRVTKGKGLGGGSASTEAENESKLYGPVTTEVFLETDF